MKKQLAVGLALLAAAIAAAPCHAQNALKANIPFAFQAGNKSMPAGEYWVQRIPNEDTYLQQIRSKDSSLNTLAPTLPVEANGGKSQPMLVFHRYGSTYFLAEIWTGGSQGRKLFKTQREKELARAATESEVMVLLQSGTERGL